MSELEEEYDILGWAYYKLEAFGVGIGLEHSAIMMEKLKKLLDDKYRKLYAEENK